MRRSAILSSLLALAAFAATSNAQRRDRGADVPFEYRPPAGMCRIWIDGLAPGLQPKPTDCATAERTAGEKTHIIYGEDVVMPPAKQPAPWCYGADGRRRDCDIQNSAEGRLDRPEGRESGVGIMERWRYPKTLPETATGHFYLRGQRSEAVRRWLGDGPLLVSIVDSDRNGHPERVIWRNDRRELLQVWIDRNGDGRTDRVEIYGKGNRVRIIQ